MLLEQIKSVRHRFTGHLEDIDKPDRKLALQDHFRKGKCRGKHHVRIQLHGLTEEENIMSPA